MSFTYPVEKEIAGMPEKGSERESIQKLNRSQFSREKKFDDQNYSRNKT